MKKFFVLMAFMAPAAFAANGEYSQFVQRQAASLEQQRQWILYAASKGEFANRDGLCEHFVSSLAAMKQNSIRTARALGENSALIEAVPLLDARKVCR
jgi:hypothetical protein